MLIKAAEALIAWNGANDGSERLPREAPLGCRRRRPLRRGTAAPGHAPTGINSPQKVVRQGGVR
jgi:hypothetical protein